MVIAAGEIAAFDAGADVQPSAEDRIRLPEAAVLTFRKGDSVFLVKGSGQGTVGTFLNFRDDYPKWADIFERNSQVRSHPVEWLEHMPR
jgi:hypothetical protein